MHDQGRGAEYHKKPGDADDTWPREGRDGDPEEEPDLKRILVLGAVLPKFGTQRHWRRDTLHVT